MMDDLRLEWTKISKNYKELGLTHLSLSLLFYIRV